MEDAAASALPNAPPEAPPEPFDVDELKGPQPFDVESLQAPAPASVPPLRAAMQPGQQFSPGVIARFRNGDAVTKAAQALAGDYATNFNAGVADDMQKFEDLGIKQGTLRTLGQALVHGAAFVKAGITAAFPAVLGGVQAGATEVLGKEGGQAVAQATAIAMTDASIQTMLMSGSQYSEATKVKRAPDGSYVDEHLGPVPDETAAAVQAQRIADYHGMPDAAETIKESYRQGVLPVEIHTDMSPEITADLAAGEVPKTYPVEQWQPAPAKMVAPEIATPGAEFSDLNNFPTVDDIDRMIQDAKMSDDEKLIRVFGSEERASRFKQLDRAQNSANTERADKAAEQMATEFPELDHPTPEIDRLVYGIGEAKQYQVDDLKTIRDAVNDTDFTPSDDPAFVAREAQRGLLDLSGKGTKDFAGALAGKYGLTDQAAAIRFARSYRALQERGLSGADIDHEITGAMIARGIEPADAADILGGIKESMASGRKATSVPESLQIAGPESARPGTTEAPKATGPTRLRPIGDQGETSISGLAETAEASAINKQLVENFGDLPELGVAKDATQGPKAEALLLKDPELARDIALNGKQPPPGTLASAVYVAVLRKAERDDDIELIRQLGTQSQFLGQVRRFGQESSYLRNVNEGDPTVAISNLQQARRDALKAKGVDVQANDNFARQEFAPIRAATKAPKPIGAWEKFMAQIRCAE